MIKQKGIILLSGGLDSVVSLAAAIEYTDIILALTFNYGQKSFEKEFIASKKIAEFYKIKHKVIDLDWLKDITNTSLVSETAVPDIEMNRLNDQQVTMDSKKSVWVPNRNGLFINIAACYADSFGYKNIIIGANKEEAVTFSDNSKAFIDEINHSLEKSTEKEVKVSAPLIDMTKDEIVEHALELNAPLHLINSCYNSTDKHCGKCESCSRLKRALLKCNQTDLINLLF